MEVLPRYPHAAGGHVVHQLRRIKERVSIEQVMAMLGIDTLKRLGAQLPGPCPIHGGCSPREFVVTPEKRLFFCFAGCGGGDQIALVSKMKTLSAKDAAAFIAEYSGNSHKLSFYKLLANFQPRRIYRRTIQYDI